MRRGTAWRFQYIAEGSRGSMKRAKNDQVWFEQEVAKLAPRLSSCPADRRSISMREREQDEPGSKTYEGRPDWVVGVKCDTASRTEPSSFGWA